MSKTWNEEELKMASEQMKKMGHMTYEEFCEHWDVNSTIEAKAYLETQMSVFEKTMAPEMKSALAVALKAMSRLIPVKIEKTDSGTFYICSNCKKIVKKNEQSHGNLNIPHCKWCGQAWDWSDSK